jgi:hypothetical protein
MNSVLLLITILLLGLSLAMSVMAFASWTKRKLEKPQPSTL